MPSIVLILEPEVTEVALELPIVDFLVLLTPDPAVAALSTSSPALDLELAIDLGLIDVRIALPSSGVAIGFKPRTLKPDEVKLGLSAPVSSRSSSGECLLLPDEAVASLDAPAALAAPADRVLLPLGLDVLVQPRAFLLLLGVVEPDVAVQVLELEVLDPLLLEERVLLPGTVTIALGAPDCALDLGELRLFLGPAGVGAVVHAATPQSLDDQLVQLPEVDLRLAPRNVTLQFTSPSDVAPRIELRAPFNFQVELDPDPELPDLGP